MKKNMKILLIVCLVLGVALMALWGYVQTNAGAIADISARVDAYKQAQAQVEMARVLGQEPDPALLEEVDFPKKLIINADIDRFEEVVTQKRAGLNQ